MPSLPVQVQPPAAVHGKGVTSYFTNKIEQAEHLINQKTQNLRRLEAQRNALNARVRLLREELQLLQEPGSYVGEVVKVMGKKKVLVKVQPEGKYGQSTRPARSQDTLSVLIRSQRLTLLLRTVVDFAPNIDVAKLTPNLRVSLRSDSCAF